MTYEGDRDTEIINHELLYEALPRFLGSEMKIMLIQGDLGSGKSVYMRLVEHQLWKAYERGVADFIPIYISLVESVDPYNCIEEILRSPMAHPTVYSQIKNS